MKTRRRLTGNEQKELIIRLVDSFPLIQSSYEYPLSDLIRNLNDPGQNRYNEIEIENENGSPVKYYLRFSSPPSTWQGLCGCAGIYTVDAQSLRALDFTMTAMS